VKKPRSDSKLLNLSQATRDKIIEILETSGVKVSDACREIKKQFDVSTSPAALSRFYPKEKSRLVNQQRLQSLAVAHEIATEAKSRPSLFNAALVERISQLAFELSIQPNANPDSVKDFFYMVIKARDQELQDRKVTVIEKKAAQADQAAGVITDQKLSPEEKQKRLRHIFGAA
jgi:hypothetical protein